MPRYQVCSIPGCSSRSDRKGCKGVKFHRLPQNSHLRHKWLVSIKRTICVSENTRICSLHFQPSNDSVVPSVFPWSLPIKHQKPPALRSPLPSRKQKPPTSPEVSLDIAGKEIIKHEEKIAELQADVLRLEAEVKTLSSQRFFLKRFEGSDSDIKFYTGLPSYAVLMCLYRYLEPLVYQLCLCHSDIKERTSARPFQPRPRALQPIDELFLVLTRLRLEQDLAHRFNISVATVSRICTTWLKFLDMQLTPLITWPS